MFVAHLTAAPVSALPPLPPTSGRGRNKGGDSPADPVERRDYVVALARQDDPETHQPVLPAADRNAGEHRRADAAHGHPGIPPQASAPVQTHAADDQTLLTLLPFPDIVTEHVRLDRRAPDRRDVLRPGRQPVGDLVGVPLPALAVGIGVQPGW